LKQIIQETEERFRAVDQENRKLRADLEKREHQQSAFTSNNRAFMEKVEIMEREA